MARPFDAFVILAGMRTGSNLLESSLNAAPGVACHGEAFNPAFPGYPNRADILGMSLSARDADPAALLARMRAQPGLNGFRYFHDHDPRVLDLVLPDRRCAKVVLIRNPAESYVSLKIARQTGQWKLGDGRNRKSARVRFDPEEFEAHLEAVQDFQLRILGALQRSGQTAFYLGYDDLGDPEVLNGLLAFLGLPEAGAEVSGALVKQNPEPAAEKVENFAEMQAALARLDRFDLSRTPVFEPRRGPGVPGFTAAAAAPLLYLPVRGGPVAEVRRWMAALDGVAEAALVSGFTQRTLRDWLRDRPGRRAFTVLRHPLSRAHAAFCGHILSGEYAEIREVLRRSYKLALPPEGAEADAEAHRAAFLGFLRFLRANLNGQTPVRVDASWASQTAVLQGFAQVLPPDLLAREETLAEDLARLAATIGHKAPPPPVPAPAGPVALADIYDAELEAAARAAYARDYAVLGFGDWRG